MDQSSYFMRHRRLVIIASLLVIVAGGAYLVYAAISANQLASKSATSPNVSHPSPSNPSSANNQAAPSDPNQPLAAQYTAPNNTYTFSYPTSWQNVTHSGDEESTLLYRAGDTTYRFRVLPPGQVNPDNVVDTTRQTDRVVYHGKSYNRTVWSVNGAAFYITATPYSSDAYYVIAMDIPADHTSDYVALFDRIAATLTY